MFVRAESVLFTGLLVTCLTGITGLSLSLSPEHVHIAPNKSVTFTCRADKEVAACEFLVRFKDKDLVVVNPAQTRSGAWQSYGQEEVVGERRQAAASVKGSDAPTRTSEKLTSGSEAQQTIVDRVQEEDVSNLNPSRPSKKQAAASQTGASTASWWQPVTDQPGVELPSSVDSPSRLASRSAVNTQPASQDQRPAWNVSVNPRLANRQNGEASSRPHKIPLLRYKDATRAPVGVVWQLPASPYSPNDTKFCRRSHVWKQGNAPRKRPVPAHSSSVLHSRFASEGYQWEASSLKEVCTLTLPEVQEGLHLIGCRMRLAEGGWQYATSSLDVNRFKAMGVTVTPPPVINAGSQTELNFKSTTPMTSCHANEYNGTLSSSRKMCRATIPAKSGLVWSTAVNKATHKEARPAFIRSRTVPTRLDYALPKTRFMEGEYFTVTCAVGSLQPPAPNMSWYIGDELLRSDADDDIPDSKWMWPWEGRALRQSLFLTVTSEDDNLPLICQVDHPDLPKPLKKSVTLHINQDIDDGTNNCGVLPNSDISERVLGGTKLTTHVPWIAAIYRRTRSGHYENVCGGTLVTRRLVVSSAQCFWDATYSRIADPSQFSVSLGSMGRDLVQSDLNVQSPGIVRIAVPKHFIGRSAFFAYDIAVLVLDSPVTLNENVAPVCIDRSGALPELQPGDWGTVAGWGVTETGRTSPVLRSIELPYVDNEECNQAVSQDLHRYITYDKFCAGYRNRSKSVCPGDSGGGLVFFDPDTERHYLRGIASVAYAPIGNDDNCFADLYTGFTLVSEYTSWIFKQAPPPPVAT